jgi:ABC-type branched-subunit amino acid transport system ATPase component
MIVGSGRPTPILTVQSLAAGYGSDWVVRHVSVQAGRGEIVTIIGPNGSGKSTLLKAVMGLVPSVEGSIVLDGVEMSGMRAELRARSGIAYVPQEREVFRSLTVRENLLMGGSGLSRSAVKEAMARVYEIYPILPALESKLAGRLSGGERKTLAGRAHVEPGADPERAAARARRTGTREDRRERRIGRAASGAGDRRRRLGLCAGRRIRGGRGRP